MLRTVTETAHMWPFFAAGWIGGPPDGYSSDDFPLLFGRPTPASWREIVYDRTLEAGVRIQAERLGLLRFDFPDWAPGVPGEVEDDFSSNVEVTVNRLRILNAYQLLAHSAFLDVENMGTQTTRLNTSDLIHIGNGGMGGPGLLRFPTTVGDKDFARMETVSIQVLDHAATTLEDVLRDDTQELLTLIDLLHLGLATFQGHDYSQSAIAAWTVCERVIAKRWQRYRDERSGEVTLPSGVKGGRINKERRKELDRFANAVVSHLLELADELPFEVWHNLKTVRKARNDYVHYGNAPTVQETQLTLSTAADLLGAEVGFPLRLSYSRTVTGY